MKPLLFKLGKQLRQLYYVLLLTGLLLNASTLPAQSLNNDVKNKLETISQYAISANDNTDHYLQQLNYERPANIAAAEWNHFPSLRKIDIAYKAAQANAQGQQFIEAFAKAIAQDYNSIKSEKSLAAHFKNAEIPKVNFSSSVSQLEKLTVPLNLKRQISTLSSYVNEGALGSMQTVFTNYLNLKEDVVYDILARSENNHVAFEQALIRSGEPPPHEVKLSNMANDLQNNYKALQQDVQLSQIAKRPTKKPVSFINEDLVSKELQLLQHANGPPKGLSLPETKKTFKPSYKKYNNYFRKNYKNVSTSFKSMRNFIRGFGGVIFGDSVRYTQSPVLKEIRWRPINDTVKDDFKKIGYLQLFFSDNSLKTFGPVSYEDVFAANAIVKDSSYKYGDGIGMVSIIDNSNISYSDNSRRFGITLHPAISHMRLGYAFVVVDALASAHNSFEKIIETGSQKAILDSFYKEGNQTWKITDKPLKIEFDGNRIKLEKIALAMWGFGAYDKVPVKSKNFNLLLPLICKNVEEYSRVNEFTKVLALFRWAQKVKSTITNISTYNSFIKQPISVVVNPNGELEFFNSKKDHSSIAGEREYHLKLLDFNRKDMNRRYASKIDSLFKWYTTITPQRESFWTSAISGSTASKDPELYFTSEDTSGYPIIFSFDTTYTDKWSENNIRFAVPDSVTYYINKRKKAQTYLAPVYSLLRSRDSISRINRLLFDKYNFKTEYDILMKFGTMSLADQKIMDNNFQKLDELDKEEKKLSLSPKYLEAVEIIADLREFRSRHRIISVAALYYLAEAEKIILKDYLSQN